MQRSRLAIWTALGPLLFLQLVVWNFYLPRAWAGNADFHCLYAAGALIRSGQGSQLYDLAALQAVPLPGKATPYIHLPYEALGFAPLTWLDFHTAYLVFLGLNVLLAAAAALLLSKASGNREWPVALAAIAGFLPISFAITNGQDSVVVLFFFAAASLALSKGRDGAAGALVGITLFRFQLALPIALLFLAWRRWKFLRGFLLAAAAALIVSLLVSGPLALLAYGGQLFSMAWGRAAGPFAQYPRGMPNLRGLVDVVSGSGPLVPLLVIAISSLVLFRAMRCAPAPEDALGLAVSIAYLISYHGYIYDLSVVLVAILPALIEPRSAPKVRCVAVVVLLSSSYFILGPSWAFLGAIPLLAFVLVSMPTQLGSPFSISLRFAAHAPKTSSNISSPS